MRERPSAEVRAILIEQIQYQRRLLSAIRLAKKLAPQVSKAIQDQIDQTALEVLSQKKASREK